MKVMIVVILLFAGFSFGFDEMKNPPPLPPGNGGLSGGWVNELNSTVWISQGVDGTLTGWYYSIVGHTEQRWWPLRGMNGQSEPSTFGFVVNWLYGKSCTAWSGQSYVVDGEDVLVTTWILTTKTDLKDDWKSTLIGKDFFRRL